jgi:hypothetical protein
MEQSENPPFSYKSEKMEIAGKAGLALTMDMKGMMGQVGNEAGPQLDKVFELMFGSAGKLSIFLAVRDKHTVVGSYVSKDRLEALLKQESPARLTDDQDVSKTVALLPKSAQGVLLWSPSGTFKFVGQVVKTIDPNAAEKIPSFPEAPPVGVATSLSARRMDVDVIVPSELVSAIADFARGIMANAGGPAPEL